jgi:hypothetical protein
MGHSIAGEVAIEPRLASRAENIRQNQSNPSANASYRIGLSAELTGSLRGKVGE